MSGSTHHHTPDRSAVNTRLMLASLQQDAGNRLPGLIQVLARGQQRRLLGAERRNVRNGEMLNRHGEGHLQMQETLPTAADPR
jgi:hypothetical protein